MLITNYQITRYHKQEKATFMFLALRSSKLASSQSSRTAMTMNERERFLNDCFICGVKSDLVHTAVNFSM